MIGSKELQKVSKELAKVMKFNDPTFRAFDDFDINDMPAQADISRRMLRRLEDIDDSSTSGPASPAARAALATSVVAHAVIELEIHLVELRRQLATRDRSK